MEKVIVFGLNKLSELMAFYIDNDARYELVAFTADDEYCDSDYFAEKPVIPFSKLNSYYASDDFGIVLTIGYSKMNNIRKMKFDEIEQKGYKVINYIHRTASILTETIGEGNIILENCSLGPFTKIGDANIIYPSTVIGHHSIIGDFNFFSINCAIAGEVIINDNCFFGINCTVKNNIKIANETLVGAGAYIQKDTEEQGVYSPVRTVKLDKCSLEIKI